MSPSLPHSLPPSLPVQLRWFRHLSSPLISILDSVRRVRCLHCKVYVQSVQRISSDSRRTWAIMEALNDNWSTWRFIRIYLFVCLLNSLKNDKETYYSHQLSWRVADDVTVWRIQCVEFWTAVITERISNDKRLLKIFTNRINCLDVLLTTSLFDVISAWNVERLWL